MKPQFDRRSPKITGSWGQCKVNGNYAVRNLKCLEGTDPGWGEKKRETQLNELTRSVNNKNEEEERKEEEEEEEEEKPRGKKQQQTKGAKSKAIKFQEKEKKKDPVKHGS